MFKLAILDMDGTVFESYLDWQFIREKLKIKKGGDILKEIYRDNQVDKERLETLEAYEKENTQKTVPIKGIKEFLTRLKNKQIPTALVTNNNTENTDFLLEKFNLDFDLVITRDLNLWKPEPDALLYAMKKYGSAPGETVSIGDSIYDVRASRRAKVPRIFVIDNAKTREFLANESSENGKDVTFFKDYLELQEILFNDNHHA